MVDLEAGFHNLKLSDSAKELTAFVTPFGLFQFNVLPFGFRNAPAEFQRVTDFVLSVFDSDCVNGYIDDIIIGTNSLDEHVLLLKQVLQRLASVGLKINVDKLQLLQQEISFLGHIVNRIGVAPDPSRYTALKSLHHPASKDELRSFLGSVNFCCRFIPNYSLIAAPLNKLLKKNVAYEWTETETAAYEALMKGLESAITLNTPTDTGDYFVFADACENGCGGAVVQLTDGVPGVLAVYSKAFTASEKNWPTREQEAFAIKFVMEKASELLAGHPVVVFTDHQSLKWIRESANARVQRWLSFLCDKDIKIVHLNGVDNFLADWLSRCVTDSDIEMEKTMEKIMVPVYPVTLDNLVMPNLQDLMGIEIPDAEKKDLKQDEKGIYVHYKSNAVYVPQQFRDVFILWHHALGVGGHRGINATVQRLRKYVYWRNMHESVRMYISGCLLSKRNSTLQRSSMSEVMGRKVPFSVVSMDAFFHRIDNIEYCVIVAIDHCTRFVVTQVVERETGANYVTLLKLFWVPYFGAPKAVLVDNKVGHEFVSYVTNGLGAYVMRSSPYNPTGNSINERSHGILKHCISLAMQSGIDISYVDAVAEATASYNFTYQLGAGDTPYFTLFGLDPIYPGMQEYAKSCDEDTRRGLLQEMRHQLVNTFVEPNKELVNKDDLQVNDVVIYWITDDEIRKSVSTSAVVMSNSLKAHWSLPCRIVSIHDKLIIIKDILTHQRQRKVSISKVKKLTRPSTIQQELDAIHITSELRKMKYSGAPGLVQKFKDAVQVVNDDTDIKTGVKRVRM